MTQQAYRSPRVTSIVGGIGLAVLLLIGLCMLSSVVKSVGLAVFYLPSRLGIADQVRPDDVAELDMQHSPSLLAFASPGRYHVYTADLDLLETAAVLEGSAVGPWLRVHSARTGEEVPVGFVRRGVRPYDTPFAAGRPILFFTIPAPGEYTLTHPSRQATLAVVPDYTTGKEPILTVAAIVEAGLVVGLAAMLLRRRGRRRPTSPRPLG